MEIPKTFNRKYRKISVDDAELQFGRMEKSTSYGDISIRKRNATSKGSRRWQDEEYNGYRRRNIQINTTNLANNPHNHQQGQPSKLLVF